MASTLVLVLESTFEVLEGALKHLSYYKHLCWFVHKHILSQSVSKHILSTLEAQMITVMVGMLPKLISVPIVWVQRW